MNIFKKTLSIVAIAGLIVAANAQGAKKTTAKSVSCPICHMTLAMKKSKMNPTAVRLTKGGKVMYCCAACKMPKSVLVKSKK